METISERMLLSDKGDAFYLSAEACKLSSTLIEWPAEPVRVRSADGIRILSGSELSQVNQLLEKTAELIKDMSEEVKHSLRTEGVQLEDVSGALATRAVTEYEKLGICTVRDAAAMLGWLRWLHCELPTSILAIYVASAMRSSTCERELRAVLGVVDELHSDSAHLTLTPTEPLFTPPSSNEIAALPADDINDVAYIMDAGAIDEGNTMACLKFCSVETLRTLKRVTL